MLTPTIEDIPDEFVYCYGHGHRYGKDYEIILRSEDRPEWASYDTGNFLVETCDNCGAERRTLLDSETGHRTRSHMKYPPGFIIQGMPPFTAEMRGACRLRYYTTRRTEESSSASGDEEEIRLDTLHEDNPRPFDGDSSGSGLSGFLPASPCCPVALR